jgi:hypothetical protein
MSVDGIFCDGRYRVRTVSFEMRMSHWVEAPIVENAETGATILDLSQEIWDLQTLREEGSELVLVMRKYPGLTNDVEVRIFAEGDKFSVAGKNVNLKELMLQLNAYE